MPKIWEPASRQSPATDLTPPELEVIRLLVRGHTTKTIAQQLSITRKTTDYHIQNILRVIQWLTGFVPGRIASRLVRLARLSA